MAITTKKITFRAPGRAPVPATVSTSKTFGEVAPQVAERFGFAGTYEGVDLRTMQRIDSDITFADLPDEVMMVNDLTPAAMG